MHSTSTVQTINPARPPKKLSCPVARRANRFQTRAVESTTITMLPGRFRTWTYQGRSLSLGNPKSFRVHH